MKEFLTGDKLHSSLDRPFRRTINLHFSLLSFQRTIIIYVQSFARQKHLCAVGKSLYSRRVISIPSSSLVCSKAKYSTPNVSSSMTPFSFNTITVSTLLFEELFIFLQKRSAFSHPGSFQRNIVRQPARAGFRQSHPILNRRKVKNSTVSTVLSFSVMTSNRDCLLVSNFFLQNISKIQKNIKTT